MNFPGLISLALSLFGKPKPPAKKNVIVGPTMKDINDFLKLAPDIDSKQYDKKVIATTTALCALLRSCGYETVFMYYHGFSTGLTLDPSRGISPTFENILEELKGGKLQSTIQEIEVFSCLCGKNAYHLFKIAEFLKTRLCAGTFMRGRNNMKFSRIDDMLLKNLNVFKDYFVLYPELDIATYLRKHNNEIVYQYFLPEESEDKIIEWSKLNFVKMNIEETHDALRKIESYRFKSFNKAKGMTISDEHTAQVKQDDFGSPQSSECYWVTFAPSSAK